MHYVGPKYFSELRDASSARFSKLTWSVFPILGCIYSLFFTLGYLLFGSQTQASLLSNFADNDRLAYLCRWAYAVVSVTMYPLVFASAATAASRGLIRVRQKLQKRAILNERFNYFAVVWAMNLLIYTIGTVFTDVGQIADFMGAIFTQLFVFVLPGFLSQTSVGLMELNESSSKLDRLKARANGNFELPNVDFISFSIRQCGTPNHHRVPISLRHHLAPPHHPTTPPPHHPSTLYSNRLLLHVYWPGAGLQPVTRLLQGVVIGP